jgi:hypothetical protein
MNEHRRRAIVYGNSLILSGVQASLKNCPSLEVTGLEHPAAKLLQELDAYCPAILIFDIKAIQPELLRSLFQQPGLLLVGIDSELHQALVWSGRQAAAVDAADLVQAIMGEGPADSSSDLGGNGSQQDNWEVCAAPSTRSRLLTTDT